MSAHQLGKDFLESALSRLVSDPGDAGTINVQSNGLAIVPLISAGAETRTLAAPSTVGQQVMLYADTATGTITLTINSGVSGLSTYAFSAAGQTLHLEAIKVAGTLKWQMAAATNQVVTSLTATSLTTSTGTVSTADGLTVGGVIVPQELVITCTVPTQATLTEQNLFVATRAYQVTSIRVVPDVAQGGALTGTVVKAVSTATPVNSTTPMHTANAIDFNATAHTVQTITLTSTTADLVLAAGNRIALDLSGALTTGRATISITLKCV